MYYKENVKNFTALLIQDRQAKHYMAAYVANTKLS